MSNWFYIQVTSRTPIENIPIGSNVLIGYFSTDDNNNIINFYNNNLNNIFTNDNSLGGGEYIWI
jgi:hypothetical protein